MPLTMHPLARARRYAGYTQQELADAAHRSRDTIRAIERGDLPSVSTLMAVAGVLGVPCASLIPGMDEAPLNDEAPARNGRSVRTSTAGHGRPRRVHAA